MLAHARVLEQPFVALTAVVPQRTQEPEGDGRVFQPLEIAELVFERRVHRVRRRHEELGNEAAVREAEGGDLAFERRREVARPPYPRMLKRVVLGLGEHVQAEHCLDHGRVRECDRLGGIGGEAEGDHWFTFWLKS